MFVKAVNTDQQRSQEATISFKGVRLGSRATLSMLESSAPGAFNSFATPEAVSIKTREIDAGETMKLVAPAGVGHGRRPQRR